MVKCAFLRYLKRFGIAEKNENQDGKLSIVTVFLTI